VTIRGWTLTTVDTVTNLTVDPIAAPRVALTYYVTSAGGITPEVKPGVSIAYVYLRGTTVQISDRFAVNLVDAEGRTRVDPNFERGFTPITRVSLAAPDNAGETAVFDRMGVPPADRSHWGSFRADSIERPTGAYTYRLPRAIGAASAPLQPGTYVNVFAPEDIDWISQPRGTGFIPSIPELQYREKLRFRDYPVDAWSNALADLVAEGALVYEPGDEQKQAAYVAQAPALLRLLAASNMLFRARLDRTSISRSTIPQYSFERVASSPRVWVRDTGETTYSTEGLSDYYITPYIPEDDVGYREVAQHQFIFKQHPNYVPSRGDTFVWHDGRIFQAMEYRRRGRSEHEVTAVTVRSRGVGYQGY